MSLRYLVTCSLLGIGIAMSSCSSGNNSAGNTTGPVGPACSTTGQCAAPTPYCDTSGGHCVQCLGDANCGGAFGNQRHCEPTSHSCVQCLTDANCTAGAPYCSSNFRCVECLTSANCGAANMTCNPTSNRCVPTCTTDANCGGFNNTRYCDTATKVCVQCLTDANCPTDAPYCVNNECHQCTTDANCTTGRPYCSPNNDCVQCLNNANCPNGGTCGLDFQCGG